MIKAQFLKKFYFIDTGGLFIYLYSTIEFILVQITIA